MPYCVRCGAWYPGRVAACERCGGALGDARPSSAARLPGPSGVDDMPAADEAFRGDWSADDSTAILPDDTAILPDRQAEPLEPVELRALVRAFEMVCARAKGRHAAPASWLPGSPRRVATALDLALEDAAERLDWSATRHLREALVDLQAFVPDDEAAAAEGFATGNHGPMARLGEAALDRVHHAQAIVIAMLRDEDTAGGAYNALRDMDGGIRIGYARRSLEAVDRYKVAQALGLAVTIGSRWLGLP